MEQNRLRNHLVTMAPRPLALLLAAALPIAGCAVGPDYHPKSASALGVPDSYSVPADGRREDLTAWWGRFDDPMLGQLVEQGRAANLDVAQAVTRLRQARESLVQARAAFLPNVSASAGYSRNVDVAGGSGFGPNGAFTLGADASYQVDLFGGIGRNAEAARANYQASGFDYATVLVSIESEIARNYVLARLAQLQLANARGQPRDPGRQPPDRRLARPGRAGVVARPGGSAGPRARRPRHRSPRSRRPTTAMSRGSAC